MYACARRVFARLASEIFLSSLQPSFSATCWKILSDRRNFVEAPHWKSGK